MVSADATGDKTKELSQNPYYGSFPSKREAGSGDRFSHPDPSAKSYNQWR
jgi:hypothetical protein